MCISCLLYLFMLLILYLLRYYNLYIYHHVRLRSNIFITGSQFSLTALKSLDSIYNSKVLPQQTQLLPLTLFFFLSFFLFFFSSFGFFAFSFFFFFFLVLSLLTFQLIRYLNRICLPIKFTSKTIIKVRSEYESFFLLQFSLAKAKGKPLKVLANTNSMPTHTRLEFIELEIALWERNPAHR